MNAPAEDPRNVLQQMSAQGIAKLCGVSEATALRWQLGRSRAPQAAITLVTLKLDGLLDSGTAQTGRDKAAAMRARMLMFHDIYNAAWHVRSAQHGTEEYRLGKVERFVSVLRRELVDCADPEALIYAVADALTAYTRGMPWDR